MFSSFDLIALQIIYDRASLLPTIATSLARMKNAESPSLRYKTATFAARVVENCDRGDCVIRGIEKGAWHVLLSSVRIPTRSRQARREVDRAALNTEAQSEATSCEPSILLPEIQRERRDYGSKPQAPIGECSQMESYETRDALFQQFQQDNSTFLDSRQCNMAEMKATHPISLAGSHGGYLEIGAKCTPDGLEMKPVSELDYSATPDFSSPFYTVNCGIPSLDVQPLTTFNEWLRSGGYTAEYTDTGASCETIISSGYDEDVCFYKSFE